MYFIDNWNITEIYYYRVYNFINGVFSILYCYLMVSDFMLRDLPYFYIGVLNCAEYKDEDLIPKNTSVIVARIPIKRPNKGRPR